ncbi:leucine-rich repeat-containing protein 59-like [Littorina saxatilis]|uniref:Leucine-rich repeat-containing protein 59 n=1 Tax=Littorina saxatilis TaxID=31220 RepID=A0AAN9G7K3_9CAEN
MPKDNLKDKLDGNELDLSLNNLEAVPVKELAAIPKATHLDVSCNLLITLPDNFCNLTHLVKVDLSKNKLTQLPAEFGKLENLQHLDLLGNQLTTLPESFSLLRKLKWLDLKDNPLVDGLKKNAGDCLDEKQCRACAQRILLYMKELSAEFERKRQKKLKEKRDKEAKLQAKEDQETKRKQAEKKAEKDRKKQEEKLRRSQQREEEPSTGEEQGQGDAAKTEKKATKKDKTGRGFCSCCVMLMSIFAVLVALVAGIVFHCGSRVTDPYCKAYYKPAETQVLQAASKTQKQAGEVYATVSKSSAEYFKVASEKASELYASGQEFAHSTYVSAMEMVERVSGGGEGREEEAAKT